MQPYKIEELSHRSMAILADLLIINAGYLFLAWQFALPPISFIYFTLLGIAGVFAGQYNRRSLQKDLNDRKMAAAGVCAGLVGSVSMWLTSKENLSIIKLIFVFIVLLFVWGRIVKSYNEHYEYIYTHKRFYVHAAILAAANGAAQLFKMPEALFGALGRTTIIYMVLSLLLLYQVKNVRFNGEEEAKTKRIFEFTVLGGILLSTFVLSIPTVANLILGNSLKAFRAVYAVIVDILIWLISPIAMFLAWLTHILRHIAEKRLGQSVKQLIEMNGEISSEKLPNTFNCEWVKYIDIIAVILMLLISMVLVRCILNYFKFRIRPEEDAFIENKTFVLNIKTQKPPGMLHRLKSGLSDSFQKLTFNLTADNKEKLRHEYKKFLKEIYQGKQLDKAWKTPGEVSAGLRHMNPSIQDEIIYITALYEEVRYGIRQPEEEELKQFKRIAKKILEVSS